MHNILCCKQYYTNLYICNLEDICLCLNFHVYEPNIFNVKNDVKNFYFLEKYRHYIKGKGRLFDKQYLLLLNIYVKRHINTAVYCCTNALKAIILFPVLACFGGGK